jgi:hypothetical protein
MANGKPAAKDKRHDRIAVADGVVGWSVVETAKKKLGLDDTGLCRALGYKSTSALAAWKQRGTAPLPIGLAVEGLVARQGRKAGASVFLVTCPPSKSTAVETVLTTLGCTVQRVV